MLEDRISIIGGHVNAASEVSAGQQIQSQPTHTRSRPPITTHVLDVAQGSPAWMLLKARRLLALTYFWKSG